MATPHPDLPDFDALWDYDHPAETEAAFRQILSEAEASGDVSYHLQLLTQIARTQGLQRRFAEAHATLDEVAARLGDELPLARVRYLLERGRVINSSGKPEASRQWFEEAYHRATEQQATFHVIDALHMLGIVTPPEERLTWNLQALALAEAATEPLAHDWCGSLLNNIGWTYHNAGQFDQALALFERALAFRQAQGNPREVRIARWCVGRTLRSLNQAQTALDVQQALYAEWAASGEQQGGYVSEEIAECLLILGRLDESRPYFAEAYALLARDPWLVAQEPERLRRLHELSGADL
jgi:tetratricopeptide (TPR) repeat protein